MFTRLTTFALFFACIFIVRASHAADVTYDCDWRVASTTSTEDHSARTVRTSRHSESSGSIKENKVTESKYYGGNHPAEHNKVLDSKAYGTSYPQERSKVIESKKFGSDYNPMHGSILDSSNF